MISYSEKKRSSLFNIPMRGCVSVETRKKHQFASSGLLLQTSSLSVVYHFHLPHTIQKYLQINPKFGGQATKSHASSERHMAEPRSSVWSSAAATSSKGRPEAEVTSPSSSQLRDRRPRDFCNFYLHSWILWIKLWFGKFLNWSDLQNPKHFQIWPAWVVYF